jgi:GcrA cell cycle regulator
MTTHSDATKSEIGRLAAAGLSASEIAAEMGLASRNVVIGLADRHPDLIKLQRTPHGGKLPGVPKPPKPRPVMRTKLPPMLCEPVEEETPADLSEFITFSELKPDSCRYPVGDRSYLFCGKPKYGELPYCSGHCRLTYRPKV